MKNNELVSIVVTVYNVEDYLPRCLETIAKQTYQSLEVILVDDGSTDCSGVICDNFARKDSRTVVVHQENAGQGAARNAGQRIARGKFLYFVDADDYLHLEAVEIMHDALKQHPQCDFAVVNHKNTNTMDEDVTEHGENTQIELTQVQLMEGFFGNPKWEFSSHVVWNKLFRKELVNGIESMNYKRAQDADFNFRVFLNTNNAVLINRHLYFRNRRPESLMRLPEDKKIRLLCMTQIYYYNYFGLPLGKEKYGSYLLEKLYTSMLFLKNNRLGKDDEKEVFQMCKDYEKATRKYYLKEKQIKNWKKVIVLMLLHSPRLTHWLMKVTKND